MISTHVHNFSIMHVVIVPKYLVDPAISLYFLIQWQQNTSQTLIILCCHSHCTCPGRSPFENSALLVSCLEGAPHYFIIMLSTPN